MLGIEHLAIHAIGDDRVVERFLQRQRARHRGGVAAFQQQPFRFRLQAGFIEQRLQRHAGIHHAMHHAVRVLAAVELRAAPFHSGIGGAFAEMRAVDARHALQIIEREDQRLVDQAMHDQPVIGRIDFGDAGMMPLEAQSVRRDDAVERVDRREAHRAFARGGQPFDVAADDIGLELRRLAISAHGDAVAERARPVRHIRRLVGGIARLRSGDRIAADRGGAARQSRFEESAARSTFAPCQPCLPPFGFSLA